jgi:hypothetical protein
MIARTDDLIKHLARSGAWPEHHCPPGRRDEPERQVQGCRCGAIRERIGWLLDAIVTFGSPDEVAVDRAVVDRRTLAPGRVVWRHTENTRGGVRAWVPCHDGQSIVATPDPAGLIVRCRARSCELTYTLLLVDEQDGGYAARWTVTPYVRIGDTTTRGGRQP